MRRCAEAGIPAAPVRSYAEAAADPHLHARDMPQPTAQPGGTVVPVTGPAAKLSRTPLRVREAAPALGAHTEEILRDLGIDDAELKRLRAARIV